MFVEFQENGNLDKTPIFVAFYENENLDKPIMFVQFYENENLDKTIMFVEFQENENLHKSIGPSIQYVRTKLGIFYPLPPPFMLTYGVTYPFSYAFLRIFVPPPLPTCVRTKWMVPIMFVEFQENDILDKTFVIGFRNIKIWSKLLRYQFYYFFSYSVCNQKTLYLLA